MGVVNVTPDSFSDGGQWFGADAAIAHGLELAAQGADIVDVGGESTRPGAQRITAEEELRRVRPVIDGLVAAGLPVSVDTMRAEVAEQAVRAGARLVNDVSGGLADPEMPRLVGAAGVPYVVMHWRGHSHSMDSRAVYQDVVREVAEELSRRVDVVTAQGVDPAMIVLDPGARLRQTARAQLGPAHQPGPDQHAGRPGAGVPGADRRVPQAVPGPAAGRAGWHAAAVRRRRRRDRVGDRAGRGGRGLVRPGAPGAGKR